jgi:uncharacterized protein (TIGR03084 family)
MAMRERVDDLAAEQADLDALVAPLDDPAWDLITAAVPWTIRDTISHLAFFDQRQTLAIRDPDGFADEINQHLGDYGDYINLALTRGRSLLPSEVLDWWRQARAEELSAFATLDPEARLPWYGPAMKAGSAVAARLMETWAHGHDIAGALGVRRQPSDRLLTIAELGVKTYSWSFLNRGLEIPPGRVRVELTAPSGRIQVWNQDGQDRISGEVEDFCLVVAQRLHFEDTSLVVEGVAARRWMEIAQIFAGPPGPGRPPRSRA